MLVGAQHLEGAEAAGGWHVSTAPSLHIPNWAVTELGLGPNPVLRSEQALGAERGQAVGTDTPRPAGGMGPSCPPEGAECRDALVLRLGGWDSRLLHGVYRQPQLRLLAAQGEDSRSLLGPSLPTSPCPTMLLPCWQAAQPCPITAAPRAVGSGDCPPPPHVLPTVTVGESSNSGSGSGAVEAPRLGTGPVWPYEDGYWGPPHSCPPRERGAQRSHNSHCHSHGRSCHQCSHIRAAAGVMAVAALDGLPLPSVMPPSKLYLGQVPSKIRIVIGYLVIFFYYFDYKLFRLDRGKAESRLSLKHEWATKDDHMFEERLI
nr:uncharacterized protein LOC123573481 [Macaca fascicularis]